MFLALVSYLRRLFFQFAHILPRKLRARGREGGNTSAFQSAISIFWCFLVSEEMQLMSGGLQAMACVGWTEAAIHGHSQPSWRKYSSGKYYWIIGPLFKIHNVYSLNEKFKKMGILLSTWLNTEAENALNQWGWKRQGLSGMVTWACVPCRCSWQAPLSSSLQSSVPEVWLIILTILVVWVAFKILFVLSCY